VQAPTDCASHQLDNRKVSYFRGYGTSRHFGAMRNLVAIGAKRTSTKPRQSSSIYEYAP
jgi:hypothetical protein